MRPRKKAAIAVGTMTLLVAACGSPTEADTDASQVSETATVEETLSEPELDESNPETGSPACQAEVLDTVVSPETVTFGNDLTVTENETGSGGVIYTLTGAASSIDKEGETADYEWACYMAWYEEAWSVSHAEIDGAPLVVKHRDQRPRTARDVCEARIKQDLVSPRSAEFTHARDGFDPAEVDEYALYGTVESQNRAGVWLESTWVCGVNWDPANETWETGHITIR